MLIAAFWSGDGAFEGTMLRSVFLALATASVAMLVFDFRDMVQRAYEDGVDTERTEPVIMEPPKDTDTETQKERPYFPKAVPVAPNSGPPQMPGHERTTAKMVGQPMTFTINDAGDVSAVGRIEPGTGRSFDEFLAKSDGKAKRVWLHSTGGSLSDALAMGRAIRKAKLSTIVPENAYCASSCPLVLAGGVEREAGRKAWIGVHQVYTLPSQVGTLQEGLAHAQQISANCQEYLTTMGVDPRAWIPAMKTAKNKLYVFTPKELVEFKLVTKAAG